MDRIRLEGMAFYGYHGAMREEQRLGQRFFIDVEMEMDLSRAAQSDALADTVNYAEVYAVIRQIAEGEPFCLLEKLGGTILAAVMKKWPEISAMTVTIHKPSAPVPGVLSDVAVILERKR